MLKSILSSYHHVLKSMWLDCKWNHHADHLIYTLIVEMLPYYETCHNSQELGFDGSNLAQKCCKEILVRTAEIPADSIHMQGDGNCFGVQSVMDLTCTYLIKLSNKPCDCPDWPRVRLCKHVATVAHFFNLLDSVPADSAPADSAPQTAPLAVTPVESEDLAGAGSDTKSDTAAAAILENVILVSREFLSNGVPLSPGTV